MTINKAYKFRLYPNNKQKELINKTLGCTRFIYNYFLSIRENEYKENKKSKTAYDCIKEIPLLYKDRPYLKEVDSCALRCAVFDLENAYQKFFKEKIHYPKYKNKYEKNSYRTNLIKSTYKGKEYQNIKLDLVNKVVTLPKLKEVKIRGYRRLKNIDGRIINATVSKENDRYYVSIVYEQNIDVKEINNPKIIGIDLGIKDLVITSEYEKYENKKEIQKYEKRIKRKQRELSRKIKGSNNYYKTKKELARIHRKLKNARKYHIHEITKKITDTKDIIVTETLKIKNMIKNHNVAKSLTDASLSEIIRELEYKSKWKGKILYKINTYYPSSQICSKCGYQNKEIKDLKIRNYECPNCHNELDRDYNAAENIMFEGLKMYLKRITLTS